MDSVIVFFKDMNSLKGISVVCCFSLSLNVSTSLGLVVLSYMCTWVETQKQVEL